MEEYSDEFKYIIWINLIIGIYNIYLWNEGGWWFNFLIGSLNIAAWVWKRHLVIGNNNKGE